MSTAVIACGALAAEVRVIARRRRWQIDVHPIPALLHNRPERIAPTLERAPKALRERYETIAIAHGDCGSYGAIDAALSHSGVRRLQGEDCYDVFAREEVRAALAEQPGTYFLTDFLARTFEHTVVRELGLDRYPSCASSTSATTHALCGWRSAPRRRPALPPSAPQSESAYRWKYGRSAMPGWSGSWSGFSARTRDTSAVMNDRVASVAALLHEAGETHHLVYRIVDGDDPDWASWYADWLLNLSELPQILGKAPVRSEFVWLLVGLDKDYSHTSPETPWPQWYAERIVGQLAA